MAPHEKMCNIISIMKFRIRLSSNTIPHYFMSKNMPNDIKKNRIKLVFIQKVKQLTGCNLSSTSIYVLQLQIAQ